MKMVIKSISSSKLLRLYWPRVLMVNKSRVRLKLCRIMGRSQYPLLRLHSKSPCFCSKRLSSNRQIFSKTLALEAVVKLQIIKAQSQLLKMK